MALLVCGGLLLYGSSRGVDLTDEVFYLIWTRNPEAYPLTYQPFGYLLNPLFNLVHGNLELYRLAGFGITAGAGALLGWSSAQRSEMRACFAAYGALAALTIFFPWIITPSYNSAANVGAMLIIAGMLNLTESDLRQAVLGIIATAGGLCCACFAKPPLFAISVAIVAIGLVRRPARRALPCIATLLLAAALISLFLAPPRMIALVSRILITQHVLALPNQVLALPAKVARDFLAAPLPLIGAAVAAACSFVLRRFALFRWAAYGAIGLSFVYLASVADDTIDGSIPDFLGLAMVTLGAGYAGLLQNQPGITLLPTTLLLLAPPAVALGTFNNQWFQLNLSIAFPLLALFALAFADAVRWRRAAALALSILSPMLIMLLAACFPYSLPTSIFEQQIPIKPPLALGIIRVDAETAAFLQGTRGLAGGALLIDLSGTGPGVAVALGARPPMLPWLNPATTTWPDVVWSRLSDAQRNRAWFILPVWPAFANSAAANWLVAHKGRFCQTMLPEITFWKKERRLQLWRPCRCQPNEVPKPSFRAEVPVPSSDHSRHYLSERQGRRFARLVRAAGQPGLDASWDRRDLPLPDLAVGFLAAVREYERLLAAL
ncbi:hypothetical protein [Rhizorhabdus argentea]|uniref:hypothetical protein n=1 Tax=Rhizorhabdus argentea TaxID=1387174 RepID=UPI0030EE81EC